MENKNNDILYTMARLKQVQRFLFEQERIFFSVEYDQPVFGISMDAMHSGCQVTSAWNKVNWWRT